ncbi:MAG: hypothetical protein ACO331_15620 [Prochlorothrix sp.]
MAFSAFKNLGETVKALQVVYQEDNFLEPLPFPISEYFQEDLQLTLTDGVVDNSEAAICENLVYPVLKEVWKAYRSHLLIWSQQFLQCDEVLSGFPEYIIARRSPLGKVVFDQPYLILVEAKQDNFDAGWGQCLAEMVAADRLNAGESWTIFGLVTNGDRWQFAKLEGQQFVRHRQFYSLQNLEELFAILNRVFQTCEQQLRSRELLLNR